jgi:hypothetical protein
MARLMVKVLILTLMPGAAIWLLSWSWLMGDDVLAIPPDASWFDQDADQRQHPDLSNLLNLDPDCQEFLLGGKTLAACLIILTLYDHGETENLNL